MFGDLSKIEEMKAKLNGVSPSFCMAKWMHVTLHLMSGRTHSCYLPATHKIPLHEIEGNPSALHNTAEKKQARKMMKEGVRPKECAICWKIEDLPGNHYSDRHYRGVDSWTMPFFDEVKNSSWDKNITPTYVEVAFSSVCNFKCSYCSPAVSTEWMKEIKNKGPYVLSDSVHQDLSWVEREGQLPLSEENNPYIEAFWKWWPELSQKLMYFRVTGGEPLLTHNTFKVLKELYVRPAPQLELSINSNLGVPRKHFIKFIDHLKPLIEEKKIRSHILHTSLDTWGEQAEYIRNGLDLKLFKENLESYLKELPECSVAFMCTFNNLSVVGFQKFLEQILDLRKRYQTDRRRILLDLPHLQGPEHQSAQILTADYLNDMDRHLEFMKKNKDSLKGFSEAEILKMSRVIEWMREEKPKEWLSRNRKNFFLYFSEHDRRRGTNFLKTFPEMAKFWRLCEKEALSRNSQFTLNLSSALRRIRSSVGL